METNIDFYLDEEDLEEQLDVACTSYSIRTRCGSLSREEALKLAPYKVGEIVTHETFAYPSLVTLVEPWDDFPMHSFNISHGDDDVYTFRVNLKPLTRKEIESLNEFIAPPGETLKEMMDGRDISISKLALLTCASELYVDEIVYNNKRITKEYARVLYWVVGPSRRFWVNLQRNYDKQVKNMGIEKLDLLLKIAEKCNREIEEMLKE